MLTFSFTQEIVLIAYNLAQDRQVLLLSWNLYSNGVRQTIKITNLLRAIVKIKQGDMIVCFW